MTKPLHLGETDILLVVDVQNDFCAGGALAVPRGHEIVPIVNRLAAKFAHVVLTEDWHPRGHLSFASSHPTAQPYQRLTSPMGRKYCGPTIAYKARPARRSAPISISRRLNWCCAKATTGRSILIPPSTKTTATPTGLRGYLRERGFKRVLLAGLCSISASATRRAP